MKSVFCLNLHLKGVVRAIIAILSIVWINSCSTYSHIDTPWLALKAKDIYTDKRIYELALAAGSGNNSRIDKIVNSGVDVNSTGKHGIPVLYWPLKKQSLRGMKKLISLGANLHYEGDEGFSVLSLASEIEDTRYLELLLESGANPNYINSYDGMSLLGNAAKTSKEMIDILLDYKANINLKDESFEQTAIFYSSIHGKYNLTVYLIERGADPYATDLMGSMIFENINSKVVKPKKGNVEYEGYMKLLEIEAQLENQPSKVN